MKHLHRRFIAAFNGLLTLLIVSLSHTSCNEPSYIGPIDGLDSLGVDTLVHCMYGVEPVGYHSVMEEEQNDAPLPAPHTILNDGSPIRLDDEKK